MRKNSLAYMVKVGGTYALCAVIWGTTWFAIRVSIAPGGYPTYEAAALRFSTATILIAGFVMPRIAELASSETRLFAWLCAAGLINALSYGLLYWGEESLPGSVAAVLFASLPLLTAILAVVTGTESISKRQIIGSAIALVGMSAIFWDRLRISPQQALGVVLIFGSIITCAIYTVIFKQRSRDVHALTATGVFLAATSLGLWVITALRGPHPLPWPLPVRPTIAILYLSVAGSIIAFAAYIYLLKQVSIMTVATLVIVEPIIALIVDRLWEYSLRLTVRIYMGLTVTLLGALISVLPTKGLLKDRSTS